MRKASLLFSTLLALVVVLAGAVTSAAPASLAAGGGPAYRAGGPLACAAGDSTWQRQEVGKVLPFRAESPHPLPAAWADAVTSPGATFLRLHFVNFELAPGDSLTVSSPDGSQAWKYTDRGPNGNGDFWSFAVDGDTVKLEINTEGSRSHGFEIVEIGHGTVSLREALPAPEVVCGTDGREAIACHTDETVINNAQRPVARLLFTSGGVQYLCTGELIRGSNSSTLITNNHCLSTQAEVSTLQATFNYQYTTCTGTTLAQTTTYAGNRLLKTNAERYNKKKPSTGLDYTLLTLQGNPEATWGELIPTKRSVAVGQQINFIQHPGGNPKKIGYWEDSAHTVRCKVDTINATYGYAAPGSQVGYGCDSEGGASGSAITAATDGKVIALHHYGGVSSSPCLNSGTAMTKICTDAGSLLICDSN